MMIWIVLLVCPITSGGPAMKFFQNIANDCGPGGDCELGIDPGKGQSSQESC